MLAEIEALFQSHGYTFERYVHNIAVDLTADDFDTTQGEWKNHCAAWELGKSSFSAVLEIWKIAPHLQITSYHLLQHNLLKCLNHPLKRLCQPIYLNRHFCLIVHF